jgi:actin-related protein
VKNVEINFLQRKLSEKFDEWLRICDRVFQPRPRRRRQRTVAKLAKEEQLSMEVATNRKERKELVMI